MQHNQTINTFTRLHVSLKMSETLRTAMRKLSLSASRGLYLKRVSPSLFRFLAFISGQEVGYLAATALNRLCFPPASCLVSALFPSLLLDQCFDCLHFDGEFKTVALRNNLLFAAVWFLYQNFVWHCYACLGQSMAFSF